MTRAEQQPTEPEPVDLLDLVRQYGGQRFMHGLDLGGAQPDEQGHEAAANALFARIEAEVNRLRAEPRSKTGGNVHRATIELAILRGLLQKPLLKMEIGAIFRQLDAVKDLLIADLKDEPTEAAADPLVLSLPQVPEDAVTLVSESTGARWVRQHGLVFKHEQLGADGAVRNLSEILWIEHLGNGGLRVEMAPPREPRTWPKVDAAPVLDSPPEKLAVNGWRWFLVEQSGGRYYQPGTPGERTIQQLRALGDVTEVFDA